MYRRVDTVCGETQQSYFSRWLRTEIAASLQMWRKAKSVFINPHIRLPYVPLRDRYLTFVPHCFSAAPLKGVEEEIVQYHHGNCTDDSAGLHLQGCLSECVSVCCFVCVCGRGRVNGQACGTQLLQLLSALDVQMHFAPESSRSQLNCSHHTGIERNSSWTPAVVCVRGSPLTRKSMCI